MIEKMKVVHIVAAASEKTALLDKLRELGVVHFTEKASADQRYLERFARLSRMEMTLQEYPKAKQETTVLSDSEFEAFYQQLSDCMERKKALLEQQAAAHGGKAGRMGPVRSGGAAGAEGTGLGDPHLPH